MSRLAQGLAGLILAGILVHSYLLAVVLAQFYLSGAGDYGLESSKWHESWGYVLGIPILLLMILTLFGRLGLRSIGVTALLVALFAVQIILDRVQIDAPYLLMLYAVNGLAMMGLTTAIDRSHHLDDDAEVPDAGPEPDANHHGPLGSQVDNGANERHPLNHQISAIDVMDGVSEGAPADSHCCLAGRLRYGAAPGLPPRMTRELRKPGPQSRISPRHGREATDIRIDKGVNDGPLRVRQ